MMRGHYSCNGARNVRLWRLVLLLIGKGGTSVGRKKDCLWHHIHFIFFNICVQVTASLLDGFLPFLTNFSCYL